MALKDWGSFVQLDETYTSPSWIWSQQYPWDLIEFRNAYGTDGEGEDIVLPQYVIDRLYDGVQVYPPSELSLFGVNFVQKATWLVELASGVIDTTSLTFDHTLTLCVGSHQLRESGEFVASINTYQPATTSITGLDLPVLALDPVGGANGSGVIGFIPAGFSVGPTSTGAPFWITAESNLLLARGRGFLSVSQTGFMTTDFSQGEVSLKLYFKITSSAESFSLSFKHWTETDVGVNIAIAVNGGSTIVKKYFRASEAGNGGDNVTIYPLRRKDFASVDFCDLLTYGFNVIDINFFSDGLSPAAQYTLMAIAVG